MTIAAQDFSTEKTSEKFDIERIRADFPILDQQISGRQLAYLDNGASTQKPRQVIDVIKQFYENDNSNVHRGIHTLSQRATDRFEAARKTVQHFINAQSEAEVIFTRGTTEAINLVAQSFVRDSFKAGDEILISAMEHHSNIVPWQILEQQIGVKLKVIPINDKGELLYEEFEKLLNEKTKLLAVTQLSNALGTITPLKKMIDAAHAVGAKVLVDGAQAIAHTHVDVQALDCDFYAFSGHKIYGPTGVGILYGKHDLLCELPPWRGGGEMIKEVTFEHTTYNDPPFKFEAGTPNIEGGIALAAAIDFVNNLGIENISAHESALIKRAAELLSELEGITLYGPSDRAGALSFNFIGIHHYDLGTLLDQMGFALRTGHHCCQPLMARFDMTGTLRASFAAYNTIEEVEALAVAVKKALMMLR